MPKLRTPPLSQLFRTSQFVSGTCGSRESRRDIGTTRTISEHCKQRRRIRQAPPLHIGEDRLAPRPPPQGDAISPLTPVHGKRGRGRVTRTAAVVTEWARGSLATRLIPAPTTEVGDGCEIHPSSFLLVESTQCRNITIEAVGRKVPRSVSSRYYNA